MGGSPVKFTEWRGTQTDTGIGGGPTRATAAKGERVVEAAATCIVAVAREFRGLRIGTRRSFVRRVPSE